MHLCQESASAFNTDDWNIILPSFFILAVIKLLDNKASWFVFGTDGRLHLNFFNSIVLKVWSTLTRNECRNTSSNSSPGARGPVIASPSTPVTGGCRSSIGTSSSGGGCIRSWAVGTGGLAITGVGGAEDSASDEDSASEAVVSLQTSDTSYSESERSSARPRRASACSCSSVKCRTARFCLSRSSRVLVHESVSKSRATKAPAFSLCALSIATSTTPCLSTRSVFVSNWAIVQIS